MKAGDRQLSISGRFVAPSSRPGRNEIQLTLSQALAVVSFGFGVFVWQLSSVFAEYSMWLRGLGVGCLCASALLAWHHRRLFPKYFRQHHDLRKLYAKSSPTSVTGAWRTKSSQM
jgi:hypothetical protein